ncbi:MAG TPA: transmembrane prediction, partial [Phycisphaerales bacterium]|nr:transmembrane prediction [Phycisphaerales bacterium]
MTRLKWLVVILLIVACLGAGVVFARRYSGRGYSERRGVPDWTPDREFSNDVFTFVRIRYSSGYRGRDYGGGYGRGRGSSGGHWAI